MKKLFVLFAALTFALASCSKKDARNIIIGQNYTVVALEDMAAGNATVVGKLFEQAPKVTFKLKEDQSGTISGGGKTYKFAWKYVSPGYGAIEIQYQNPGQYGSEEVTAILEKMSGTYHTDRTNGLRISPNEGIDMDNQKVKQRMAAE